MGVSNKLHAPAALPCAITLKANQTKGGCNANGSLAYGDWCLLACDAQYSPSGSQNVTCTTANDTSVQSAGSCVPNPCDITLGLNMTLGNCTVGLQYGSSCDIQCNTGYYADSDPTVTCASPDDEITVPDICKRMCH
jgi:hypothetical protein